MQSQLSRAWKLGLTTSHGVPSPKVPSMTWMLTWQHFVEVRGLELVSRVKFFAKNNQDSASMKSKFNVFFEGSRIGTFASMLRLANVSGTWDLGPHANDPKLLHSEMRMTPL